jgi:site-specific recombinase XerD
MLIELFPRHHARFSSLPLLGPYVDGFVGWLHAQGYPRLPIRLRVRETPRVDLLLRRRRIRRLEDLPAAKLLALAPRNSQEDIYLAAVVRSLARFLETRGLLACPVAATRGEQLIAAFRAHLDEVRGLAETTLTHHCSTAAELLAFLGFDDDPGSIRRLGTRRIEAFIGTISPRLCRASLQHTVAHLRSFLRFLALRGIVADELATSIDTPRLYRGGQLPRSLPWETVQAFLAAIDRSTPMGRRDYAMFLLISTYGLRASEVASLRIDDIEWRAARLRIRRPKTKTPIILPLTEEIGAALVDYLRFARADLPCREVFLRMRAPAGPIAPTAVTEAFQAWTRRGGFAIPYQGPHCLRHSLAVHLLRQGTSIKSIGDLLGHRSIESTCVYLRLHVDDLRDAALEVPVVRR